MSSEQWQQMVEALEKARCGERVEDGLVKDLADAASALDRAKDMIVYGSDTVSGVCHE